MEKYLMLDRRLLSPQGMANLKLEASHPVKDEEHNPLFTEDRPWEVRIDNGYPNVIYDREANCYRCYYTLFIEDEDSRCAGPKERTERDYIPRPDRVPGLAYAESADGIHWEKPSLGFVDWHGSRENNLIFPFAHGTGVMFDERETDPSRRYKMVTKMDQPGTEAYMAVSFSPDGVHWETPTPWPEHNPPADSHNLPFWSEEESCYMVLSRVWRDGIRVTTLSRSQDFIHWSEPKETLRGTGFENQIYAMPAFRWGNIYLGLASVIHEGDRTEPDFDQVDLELTWAADPWKFDFAAPGQPILPRGEGSYPDGAFDCCCIYASPLVTAPDGSLWLYYMGGNGQHTNFRETSLGRAKWEADRFVSLSPRRPQEESVLPTASLFINGGRLELLADPADPGQPMEVSAALATAWNREPLPGFDYGDSAVTAGEDGWLSIRFSGGLENLAGQKLSLILRMKNAKVWAVRGDIALAGHRLWEGAE